MILSLSLINLLEQLIELTETFHLLYHWIIIKDYNSGTAKIAEMKRKGKRKVLGRLHGPTSTSLCASASTPFSKQSAENGTT